MPRKTVIRSAPLPDHSVASMRPRPDAAENPFRASLPVPEHSSFNEAAARCRGKRPPAEKLGRGRHASMRPRPDAAENPVARPILRAPPVASMRPRPDAAENTARRTLSTWRSACFNEAAARCRGKRPLRDHGALRAAASMRPRPDAAENFLDGAPLAAPVAASMRPRPDAAENPGCVCRHDLQVGGFNEAAARCRGKQTNGSAPATDCDGLQ